MIFVISDTHYNHGRIIKHCSRPFESREEMNDYIVEKHNSVVGPDDIVWHLGDVAWGSQKYYDEYFDRCNGNFVIFVGNHDRVRQFKSHHPILALYEFGKPHIQLEHNQWFDIAHVSDGLGPWKPHPDPRVPMPIRLVGHSHNALPKWIDWKREWCKKTRTWIGEARPWYALNMSVEHWDYTPMPLDDVITAYQMHWEKRRVEEFHESGE